MVSLQISFSLSVSTSGRSDFVWIQSVNKHVWVWNLFRWFYCKLLWELHSTKNDPCWLSKSKGVVAVVWCNEIIDIAKKGEGWLNTSMLRFPVRFFLFQKVDKLSKIFPNMYSESFWQNFWLPIFIASSSCSLQTDSWPQKFKYIHITIVVAVVFWYVSALDISFFLILY